MNDALERMVGRLTGRMLAALREDPNLRADMLDLLRGVSQILLDDRQYHSHGSEGKAQDARPDPANLAGISPERAAWLDAAVARETESRSAGVSEALSQILSKTGASAPRDERSERSYASNRYAGGGGYSYSSDMGNTQYEIEQLRRVEGCLRVKAEATFWAIERMKLLNEGSDYELEIRPRDREIHQRANNYPDCFLWMAGTFTPSSETAEDWVHLGHSFETLAEAVELIRECLVQGENSAAYFEQALDLAAECQSSLRVAVENVGQGYDPHQVEFFRYLKRITNVRQIFIERHMRLTDPADPSKWESLQERIRAVGKGNSDSSNRHKDQEKLFSKVRYHGEKIKQAEGAGMMADWQTLFAAMEELIGCGISPSSVELLDVLLPIVEDLPPIAGEYPNVELALREIDRFLAQSPPPSEGDDDGEGEPEIVLAPSVGEVRRLLEGRTIALIGGEVRATAQKILEEEFGLGSLLWISSIQHQDVEELRSSLSDDSIVLVLHAIRWSSHSFGDVKSLCDDIGKPLVRLPAGYNVNQVAKQILDQAGGRLGALR